MLQFLSGLFGFGRGENIIKETVEVFRPNAEKESQRTAEQKAAVSAQYAAEFRANRNWFDSLVDGVNRLPRPLIAFGVIYLFIDAMTSPTGFAEKMVGLAAIPDQLWWIIGAVISFFFGAREIQKGREDNIERIVKTAAAQTEAIQKIRELDEDQPDENPALTDWKNSNG